MSAAIEAISRWELAVVLNTSELHKLEKSSEVQERQSGPEANASSKGTSRVAGCPNSEFRSTQRLQYPLI